MLLNGLRRAGSLLLTLGTFLIGPLLMVLVCIAVGMLVVFSQFLFVLPLLAVFVVPFIAISNWLKPKPQSVQGSTVVR
jgi:hypothetical protein